MAVLTFPTEHADATPANEALSAPRQRGATGSNRAVVRAALVAMTATLLVVGLALLAAHNLGYRGMWWDEATQFWVSQGVSRTSEPFTPSGGVRDVIRANCLENLDPGGFSVLLHLWTTGGRSLEWLRALPLSFLIVGMLALGLLGWRLTHSALFALGACAVPLLYPAALYFGLELRAYGMEMAGVAVGALALAYAQDRPTPGRALVLGLTCAAFLTSRYSFIFVALPLGAALGWACARGAPRAARTRCLLAFLLPVCLIAGPVWGVTLHYQIWPEMRSGPLGIVSPVYARAAVLGQGANALAMTWRNLFSPTALPITVCILVAIFGRARAGAKPASAPPDPPLEGSLDRTTTLATTVAGIQAVSCVASILGVYPWDIASRWSAYLVMLSALALVVLAAEARSFVHASARARPHTKLLRRRLQLLGAGVAAVAVVAGSSRAIAHRQFVEQLRRTNVALQIDLLPVPSLRERSVFVAYYEVPMVRYLYEYGPYRGRTEYPRDFRFETVQEWHDKAQFAARAEGIAFIVSALPLAEAQSRFPGVALRPFGPVASRLLAVATGSAAPRASRTAAPGHP